MCYVKTKNLRAFGLAACLFAAFSFPTPSFGMKKQEIEVKVESVQTDWIKYVNAATGENKSGEFSTKDKLGNPVILEWEKITPIEKSFSGDIQRFSDLMSEILIEINIDYAKKNPEKLYKESKDLFKDGKKGIENVDFDLLKEKISSFVKKLFFDTHYCNPNDVLFFIKAKDEGAKEILGVALFIISYDCDYGNVFLDSLFFKPKAQKRGLCKLATSLIFKILPDVKSIALDVLMKNENAIAAYSAIGFEKQNSFWGDFVSFLKSGRVKVSFAMEYKVEKSNKLQDAAKSLKLVK